MGSQTVTTADPCGPTGGGRVVGGAWGPLGDRFVLAESQGALGAVPDPSIAYRARKLVGTTIQGDGNDIQVSNRWTTDDFFGNSIGTGHINASGVEMLWFEAVPPFGPGSAQHCKWVRRAATSPFGIIAESATAVTNDGSCSAPVAATRRLKGGGN